MTPELLTSLLVERIMGWRVAPGRFLMSNRQWMPRSRFRPTCDLRHAFRVLGEASPEEFNIARKVHGDCCVRVRIRGVWGEASSDSIPLAICVAAARALGFEVDCQEHE